MDINSLLSPQDSPVQNHRNLSLKSSANSSPARNGSTPAAREVEHLPSSNAPSMNTSSNNAKSRKKDQLLHQAVVYPLNLPTPTPSYIQPSPPSQSNGAYFAGPQFNSPTSSRGPRSSLNSQTADAPQNRPTPAPLQQRQQQQQPSSSSSLLDTLADLASMQQHHRQNSRETSISYRSSDLRDQTRASPQMYNPSNFLWAGDPSPTRETYADYLKRSPAILSRMRTSSIISTLSDHGMGDTPTSVVVPRRFSSKSLGLTELDQVTSLTKQLLDNPYDYNAHVRLLTLLHRGFINHVTATTGDINSASLHEYDLLPDLRQAREAMSARFPVGETLWLEWLHDEAMLAATPDQQTTVIELCKRAVDEEIGSSQLWRFYGDWMFLLYKMSHEIDWTYRDNTFLEGTVGQLNLNNVLGEEDKLVSREVFTLERMLQIWQQGAKACQWHIGESHLVWFPYLEIEIYTLSLNPSAGKIHHVGSIFTDRLRQPQAAWDQTFEIFSNFVTEYDERRYEERMVSASSQAAKAKNEWQVRENFEARLHNAQTAQDHAEEWNVMSEYLEFETSQSGKKHAPPLNLELQLGLYERANLRFPADADFWEDHADIIFDRKPAYNSSPSSILERATRHCPWSGNLWTKRVLALEAAQEEFHVLEDIKHLATSSGLLEEVGGIDELIKVYVAWCGFLRRRAFKPGAGEDEVDIAEVGIRSAMDSIKEVGEKKFGKGFKSDPLFRVERIYFKFLAQTGGIADGRKFWHQLTLTHGDSYDFWERYYLWEMTLWGKELGSGPSSVATPTHATSCLQRAIRRPNLDWPERMIDLYLHHCAQHETVQKIQEAQIECRKAGKLVARKRSKDAAEAASHAVSQDHYADKSHQVSSEDYASSKRKREEEAQGTNPSKKPRQHSASERQDVETESTSHESQLKRDRENTTVVVRNLPADSSESRIKQFFKDCGHIVSFSSLAEKDGKSTTATIEFESKEDMLTALTKDMKLLNGQEIRVQAGTGATLWVTNYPPEADEDYMRQLFSPFGDIVEVRFPSLKLNTHRRFCYVQFLTSDQANAATELDGKALGGQFKLNAKISDPNIRHDRSGAMEEGREIFIGQLDYASTEDEVRQLFSKFGQVQSVRIPKRMNGQSKGTAFVRFETKEQAEQATSMNLSSHRDRILKVTLSTPNRGNKKKSAILNAESSGLPSDTQNSASSSARQAVSAGEGIDTDYRSRTLVLKDIPDTVNDARIKALCEQYGTLKKVTLRPERGGAFVEFASVADVGKAMMALDGYELIPGHKIEAADYREGLQGTQDKPAVKTSYGQGHKNVAAAPISRPRQPGQKKRAGLGFVRASQAGVATTKGDGDPRSQDDFRAMLAGKPAANGADTNQK